MWWRVVTEGKRNGQYDADKGYERINVKKKREY